MHYHIRTESEDTGKLLRQHWHTDDYEKAMWFLLTFKSLVHADIRRVMRCHNDTERFKEV